MAKLQFISKLALALSLSGSAFAQISSPFEDPATGITYQQTVQGDFTFGIALPETASTDFIGRISVKATQGWAGVSLGGPMGNSLMIIAIPNNGQVTSALRKSSGYANPPVYSGSAQLKPIATGTSNDGTSYTLTFLCEGCIQTDGSTFTLSDDPAVLGYGRSNTAVSNPASPATALNFHSAGFGMYAMDLNAAKSAKFAQWAALASGSTPTPPGNGNGTQPNPPTTPVPGNGTVPISNSTYDYIVVGGGPAGLVASQRLTETGRSVLLIERGKASVASSGGNLLLPWNQSLTAYDVPAMFNSLSRFPGMDAYCDDTAIVAGCILGGGGSVNGMAFIHPPSFDFDDQWPQGWKWSDVKPSADRFYSRNPGTTLPSRDGKYYDNAVYDVLEPWYKDNGWSYVDGIKDPDSKVKVYGPPSLNVANGLRSGPVQTYLPLAKAKSNFKLQLNTKVIRVVRNGSTVAGVEVEDSTGQRQIINLNLGGSVILSAGAMSTPRILFRSGIGPEDQINNVKTGTTSVTLPPESDWINLPVGKDAKDHSLYMLTWNVTGGLTSYSDAQLADPSEADKQLFNAGSGVLTQSFQRMDTFTRVNTSDGHQIVVQTHISSMANDTLRMVALMCHGLTSKGVLGINAEGNTLFTTSPWANTDTDKEAWTIAIDELLDMSRRPGSPVVYSGGKDVKAASIVSSPASAGVHVVGTAKMGTDDGRSGGTAVVDLNTKVYGTDNLFVVDASFHPDLPTGNTQAIVMVAAERAVERIIALHKGGSGSEGSESCSAKKKRSALKRSRFSRH